MPVVTPVSRPKPTVTGLQPAKVERRRTASLPANPVVAAIEPVDGPAVPSGPAEAAPEQSAVSVTELAEVGDSLRLYGEAIRARIQAHKPTRIRLHGSVGLTFSISNDGRLLAAVVSMSSGSSILDQAALTAVQEAAPFPPPPETTPTPQFSIPFQFR
ncbi:MAG TPA: TonB family protein [Telmatospirillum sp.]|nr:TonB family protein [Telmatospirillum sp.]